MSDASATPRDPGAPAEGALAGVVREIEAHAAAAGWDRPPALFALVPTADLLRREPGLAELLGVAPDDGRPELLTPVEQDALGADRPLEEVLSSIMWPAEVAGCAAVVERLVLPPTDDGQVPTDAADASAYAADHPERQEVRLVAAVTREGERWCALRMRAHDDAAAVLAAPDLVPGLLELLASTLDQ